MMGWLFDTLLAVGLLWLAWRTVASPSLFRAIVLFITFGLLMALTWSRLGAPDVALAEAAIGAGLTGALLLEAYRELLTAGDDDRSALQSPLRRGMALLCAALVGGLAWVLAGLPQEEAELGPLVRARLAESGVDNPVTAVLLNFRAYDTLLEVAVLALALLGVWAVSQGGDSVPVAPPSPAHDSALVGTLVRLLAPLAVLVGAYLLWAGAHAPGGAFQAGAVLAGMGVLLRLVDWIRPAEATSLWRFLAILGLAVFCAVAQVVMLAGNNLLQYPPDWAGLLIMLIESALTVSIALILVLVFSGSPGLRRP